MQKYIPGDLVHLIYSSTGHIHGTENPRDYYWLSKGKYGMVISGLGRTSRESPDEIEHLVLIDGMLYWIENDCLEHLFK